MKSPRILIDISEFAEFPISTGIQRVVRMLIEYWPRNLPTDFVMIDGQTGDFIKLPPQALIALTNVPSHLTLEETRSASFEILKECHDAIAPDETHHVLIPEVFFNKRRIDFYKRRSAELLGRIYVLVYDFRPYTDPDVYRTGPNGALGLMPYLMFVTACPNRCFISRQTRDVFSKRILRISELDDPVFALGCDSFNIGRQSFAKSRKDLLCIGTFEGKKRQELVFEAFQQLEKRERGGCRLVFIGRVPNDPPAWLLSVLNNDADDIVVMRAPDDAVLGEAFRTARATLFTSTIEGYGLPPLESLHLGVPVVVHTGLPSLEHLPGNGQIRLPDVTVPAIKEALRILLDPTRVEALWEEASSLRLPRWKEFAENLARWVGAQPVDRQVAKHPNSWG